MIDIFHFVALAAKFKLQESLGMQNQLVLKYLQVCGSRGYRFGSSQDGGNSEAQVHGLLSRLAAAGCHEAGCSIAEELFKWHRFL